MSRVPKLPTPAQAWAALAALAGQADGDNDVQAPDYIGPVPVRVIAAALLDINRRLTALEGGRPGA
jgi:hypothetical protein